MQKKTSLFFVISGLLLFIFLTGFIVLIKPPGGGPFRSLWNWEAAYDSDYPDAFTRDQVRRALMLKHALYCRDYVYTDSVSDITWLEEAGGKWVSLKCICNKYIDEAVLYDLAYMPELSDFPKMRIAVGGDTSYNYDSCTVSRLHPDIVDIHAYANLPQQHINVKFTVPQSWVGRQATIEAIHYTTRHHTILFNHRTIGAQVNEWNYNFANLLEGMYAITIGDGNGRIIGATQTLVKK